MLYPYIVAQVLSVLRHAELAAAILLFPGEQLQSLRSLRIHPPLGSLSEKICTPLSQLLKLGIIPKT